MNRSGEHWLWTAATSGRMGYGSHRIKRLGRTFQAHRLVYVLANGAIEDGICVLHSCDIPLCCKPEHLFIGTVRDNNLDRAKKGRSRPCIGERSPNHKLFMEDVAAIRAEYVKGRRGKRDGNSSELALKYGVSTRTITGIVTGQYWSHSVESARGGRWLQPIA